MFPVELTPLLFLITSPIFCYSIFSPKNYIDPNRLSPSIVIIPISFNGHAYFTRLSLGTPEQKFELEVATRRQELWIQSSQCGKNCRYKPKYDSRISTTYTADGRQVSTVIDGAFDKIDGFLSQDTVSLPRDAQVNVNPQVTYSSVPFIEVTNVPDMFYDNSNISGSLGLGFKRTLQDASLIDKIYEKSVMEKVAAFYIKRVKYNQVVEDAGEVLIGTAGRQSWIDGIRFNRNGITFDRNGITFNRNGITWVNGDKTKDNDLSVRVEEIEIGFTKIKDCFITNIHEADQKGCDAVFSLSDPYIRLQEEDSFRLNNQLGFIPELRLGFVTDCNRIKELPDVKILINGFEAIIPPSDYLVELEDDKEGGEERVCLSLFTASEGADKDYIVFGQPFFKNVYTMLDWEKNRFGFAKFKPGFDD